MTAKLVRDGLDRLTAADSRNRFFTGKFLSARDLSDEQAYFLQRRRLHNLIHGWGIVAGFEVDIDPSNRCRVIVQPGFALDPLGRELILREPVSQPLPSDRDSHFIVVRHAEVDEETVPVLVPDPNPAPDKKDEQPRTDQNRLVEKVDVAVVDPIEISARQWLGQTGEHGSAGCRDAVPLAHIVGETIDLSGRRMLGDSDFTRIVDINWTHGGKAKARLIRDEGLQVTFSGPIDPATIPIEVLECRLEGRDGSSPLMLCADEAHAVLGPDGEVDDRCIRFDFDASAQEALQRGRKIFLQLHCDFLLDRTGMAVDGNFLGGSLPTGNGRPGGSFISWFELD